MLEREKVILQGGVRCPKCGGCFIPSQLRDNLLPLHNKENKIDGEGCSGSRKPGIPVEIEIPGIFEIDEAMTPN